MWVGLGSFLVVYYASKGDPRPHSLTAASFHKKNWLLCTHLVIFGTGRCVSIRAPRDAVSLGLGSSTFYCAFRHCPRRSIAVLLAGFKAATDERYL